MHHLTRSPCWPLLQHQANFDVFSSSKDRWLDMLLVETVAVITNQWQELKHCWDVTSWELLVLSLCSGSLAALTGASSCTTHSEQHQSPSIRMACKYAPFFRRLSLSAISRALELKGWPSVNLRSACFMDTSGIITSTPSPYQFRLRVLQFFFSLRYTTLALPCSS